MTSVIRKLHRKLGVILQGGAGVVLRRWRLLRRDRDRYSAESLRKEGWASQNGQDKFVVALLKGRRDGCFVDIGAYDGQDISNTVYLERQLGWRGICVEPIPAIFEKLRAARNCICECACISVRDGTDTFVVVHDNETMSGLKSTMTAAHLSRIASDQTEEIAVPCHRFDTLLKRNHVDRVDFLSIDTEGSELDILRSIDFAATPISIICVENTYHGDEIALLLSKQGYQIEGILGGDEIYVKLP